MNYAKFSSEMSYKCYSRVSRLTPYYSLCIQSDETVYNVLSYSEIKEMFKVSNYDIIKRVDANKLVNCNGMKKNAIKYCDTESIQYLFPDITNKEIVNLLLKYSRKECIMKISSENPPFLQVVVAKARRHNIEDIELLEFLHNNGLEIRKADAINSIKKHKIESVKWIFSKIDKKKYPAISYELKHTNFYSKYPEVVIWAKNNDIYTHPNMAAFAICNGLDTSLLDPNPPLTEELVGHYASLNKFDKIKDYNFKKLVCTPSLARVLYFGFIYNNKNVFEKYITFFLNFQETELILNIGGIEAFEHMCSLLQYQRDLPHEVIRPNSNTLSFMNKYASKIAEMCPPLAEIPTIRTLFFNIDNVLHFYKCGKLNEFYELCKTTDGYSRPEWKNFDYIYSSKDQKLIDTVSDIMYEPIGYPKYRLKEETYQAVYKAFVSRDILSEMLQLSLSNACYDVIEDLVNIGVKFQKHHINYAFCAGAPIVNWLLSSGLYDFPITQELIEYCISLSPYLKEDIVKWTKNTEITIHKETI